MAVATSMCTSKHLKTYSNLSNQLPLGSEWVSLKVRPSPKYYISHHTDMHLPVLLMLRTYALYGQSRKIFILFALLWMVSLPDICVLPSSLQLWVD